MTRDDVVRLASEAGFDVYDANGAIYATSECTAELERFAALVAAHVLARTPPQPIVLKTADIDPELLREMFAKAPAMPLMPMPPEPDVAAAVAAEREACAQVCEGMHEEDRPGDYAYAIRARWRAS